MRPLLVVLGLAFVATVLLDNADAIKCYIEDPRTSGGKKNATVCPKTYYIAPTTSCFIHKDEYGVWRDCAAGPVCEDYKGVENFRCCSTDLCNVGNP